MVFGNRFATPVFGIVYNVRCVHSALHILHGVPLHRCDGRNCEEACCARYFQVLPQRHFGWLFSQQCTHREQTFALSWMTGLLMSTAGTQSHSKRSRAAEAQSHRISPFCKVRCVRKKTYWHTVRQKGQTSRAHMPGQCQNDQKEMVQTQNNQNAITL